MNNTEILKADERDSGKQFYYEVEIRTMTWAERKMDIRAGKHTLVYDAHDYRWPQGVVLTWFSIGKDRWEKCRKVIRKITPLDKEYYELP